MGLLDFFRKKDKKESNQNTVNVQPQEPKKEIKFTYSIGINNEIPSLEDLVEKAFPSEQGLYPHEILMLDYASTYKITGNTFPQFWLYQYGVKEPQKILKSLYDRGFITVGSIKDTLQKLKVSDLKSELSRVGAKTTGKKEALVNRVLETEDAASLEEKFPEKYFVLTEKGTKEVQDNEYIRYLHRTHYMGIWEMNRLLQGKNRYHKQYRDVLWGDFNRQLLEHFTNLNFGLYRNTCLSMYSFLMEEERYRDAFSSLCQVIYCDLSGLGNSERMLFDEDNRNFRFSIKMKLESCFPYKDSIAKIIPGMKDNLIALQKGFEWDNGSLRNAVQEEFEKCTLPYHIFTVEECTDIVMGEVENQTDIVEKIYQEAEKRMIEEYDKNK